MPNVEGARAPSNRRPTARNLAAVPANGRVVSYWADKSSATTGWTVPASATRRTLNVGSGNGRITSVSADTGLTAAGGPWQGPTATASAASAKATMWSVALQPVR